MKSTRTMYKIGIARIFRRLRKNPSGVATEEGWKAVKIGAEVAFEVAFPWHKRPS